MKVSSFLKFVEIQTKVASVLPFTIGILYTVYRFEKLDFKTMIIFFISMLTFDMAATAINNYMDQKDINKKLALALIFTLLLIAVITGFTVFLLTNWVILTLGILCFIVGITYSFGPIPIYRTPLGELFSGFFMGGLILFITVYTQVWDRGFILFEFSRNMIDIKLNYKELINIILLSIPLICMIANIMLANNICDVEKDIENRRYTLAYYLGNRLSVKLFILLYVVSYIVIIAAAFFRILPIYGLITVITIIPVFKNLKLFYKEQVKSRTFVYSVKNFIIISISIILSFFIEFLIHLF